jgi:hypothetical protein
VNDKELHTIASVHQALLQEYNLLLTRHLKLINKLEELRKTPEVYILLKDFNEAISEAVNEINQTL